MPERDALVLGAAFLTDAAIGDPRMLPHPVRIIGRWIQAVESLLRRFCKTPGTELAGGALLVIAVVAPVFFCTQYAERALLGLINGSEGLVAPVLGFVLIVYLTATTIAVRELTGSARLVMEEVRKKRLEDARYNLSMIVGRDTKDLSEDKILRATMETLAENLSDGIVAPLFYLAIGGLPLAMAYKAVNTLDSMVGYKNERYLYFGRASARLDDLANYLPARLTGFIAAAASTLIFKSLSAGNRALRTMFRDGQNHTSPNSGVPEAAVAGAVGVMFGGPSTYGGRVVEKPVIGSDSGVDYMLAAERTISLIKASSIIAVAAACAVIMVKN